MQVAATDVVAEEQDEDAEELPPKEGKQEVSDGSGTDSGTVSDAPPVGPPPLLALRADGVERYEEGQNEQEEEEAQEEAPGGCRPLPRPVGSGRAQRAVAQAGRRRARAGPRLRVAPRAAPAHRGGVPRPDPAARRRHVPPAVPPPRHGAGRRRQGERRLSGADPWAQVRQARAADLQEQTPARHEAVCARGVGGVSRGAQRGGRCSAHGEQSPPPLPRRRWRWCSPACEASPTCGRGRTATPSSR